MFHSIYHDTAVVLRAKSYARISLMTIEERINLIKEAGEEITEEDELRMIIGSGKPLIAYDGFEPSGRMHIAQGLLRTINVNKLVRAGASFKMLIADWHALANNKMGGDLSKIRRVGEYFIEVWKASGMNLENVEFVWASDFIRNTPDYWLTVIKIAKENSVKRIIRCAQIMGRSETETLSAAQIIYPCMQVADIFLLGANITQLGMDQRKVNMLAREIGEKLGFWKPVVVSHHMLMGLQKIDYRGKDPRERTIELKMSKSMPGTSIFMTDGYAEINQKVSRAYCPPLQVEENPILEYFKYIIFESDNLKQDGSIIIRRSTDHGGDLPIDSYRKLESQYLEGKIHPADLKETLTRYLDDLLKPVRDYFEANPEAKGLKEEVESFNVTR